MHSTRGIIQRLLTNLGSAREVDQYLKQYGSMDAARFALIKVGGAVVKDDLANLASALSFLNQVGLTPIVIHGAGEQLDEALDQEGIESSRKDGMRITTPQILEIARRVFQKVNLQIVEELESLNTRARPITSGVFEAELMAGGDYGLVGEVTEIHLEQVNSAIRSGHVPILACLGETESGQILNINADVAASELAVAVQPHKIVFLTPTGGLLDDKNRIIPAINLTEDYDNLMAQKWVSGGMRVKLREIKELLDRLPDSTSVSITSPDHLAKELFTHQGSGTLVRMGEQVRLFHSFDEVDKARLKTLLETCFGRELAPDYFETKELDRLYLTDSYRATAIITREHAPLPPGRRVALDTEGPGVRARHSPLPSGEGPGVRGNVNGPDVPYLDKFAVTQEAQGQGLGASLWGRMRREVPQLYWRSRSGNPINPWYFLQAGGCFRSEKWVVFWYGLDSYEEIRACVESALALPATFMEQAVVA